MNDGEKVVISKIRPGDRVTLVPLEVTAIEMGGRQGVRVVLSERTSSVYWADPDQIATHHPAPREFQVGDRVVVGGFVQGTIKRIVGRKAHAVFDNGADDWWPLSSFTLVEDGE